MASSYNCTLPGAEKQVVLLPSGDSAEDHRAWGAWYWDAMGWCVVPAWQLMRDGDRIGCACPRGVACDKPGKHPMDKWREGIPLATLRNGWASAPRKANLALLTGQRSGVVVADVDPRHGGTLDALWALGWPQDTLQVRSGSGGWHVYAACPPEGLASAGSYAPGIELKADGTIAILPPSIHIARRRYRWLSGHAPWERAVAPLPEAVLAAAKQRVTRGIAMGAAQPDRDSLTVLAYSLPETQRIATALIQKAIRKVREDGEGRNNTAFWLARQLDSLGLMRREVATLTALFGRVVQHG